MPAEKKQLEQFDSIGGWLWLPAIWTVTNFLVAGYSITVIPIIGWILMGFAAVNAYLFWTRSFLYRWYFLLHGLVTLVLSAAIAGPRGVGGGSAWVIFFMFYLLFSKRARGTFTQPLVKKPKAAVVQQP